MSEKMEITGILTAYTAAGQGRDVILLHGWGSKKELMQKIADHLDAHFRVWNLDFPGFGESGLPPCAWGVPDYENFLAAFIQAQKIENPILIAHSFGCRVAIRYCADHPGQVRKMCLTGAAGIRPKRDLGWYLRTGTYKAGKKLVQLSGSRKLMEQMQSSAGSEDYRNAQGVMKPTFVKVVNDDVTPVLGNVKCPVLLVWGDQDTAAPLWMGKEMEQKMPDAGLAIFEGDDHWAYYHQADRFNRCLDIFLKEDQTL